MTVRMQNASFLDVNVYINKKNPNDENRTTFLNSRNSYAYIRRCVKYRYNKKEGATISSLCQKNPRNLWKHLNKYRKSNTNSSNLTADDFVKHFSSNPTNDNNYFNEDNNDIDTDINILLEELDKPLYLSYLKKNPCFNQIKHCATCIYSINYLYTFIYTYDYVFVYICCGH